MEWSGLSRTRLQPAKDDDYAVNGDDGLQLSENKMKQFINFLLIITIKKDLEYKSDSSVNNLHTKKIIKMHKIVNNT